MKTSITPSLLALHATALAAESAVNAAPWPESSELAAARSDSGTALADAIVAAEWGSQPDGSFLTISMGFDGRREMRMLRAPSKGGPLAKVVDGVLLKLWTREEARVLREEQRARNRLRLEEYEVALSHVVDLLRAGVAVPYCSGQEGGVLYANGTYSVSACGALRRLGLDLSDARVAYTTHCRGVMSIPCITEPTPARRSVSARLRRLPASDRAAALGFE